MNIFENFLKDFFMKAVIVGNGNFPKSEYPRYILKNADIIICCDGGLRQYLRNMEAVFGGERLPDAIVGDLDSLGEKLRKQFKDRIIYIEEQDDNDQTKSFRYLLDNYKNIDEVHSIAATGKREDHTIGNLSLMMEYERSFHITERGIKISMVSDYSTSFPIWDSCELHLGKGRRISLISPDNSLNLKSEGLEYQTSGVIFDNWWKATLNRATEDIVKLTFNHPSMLLVIIN